MAEATKPVKSDYDRVEVVSRWKNLVIIGSTIVTLGLTLDEKYKLSALHTVLRDYITVIVGLNVMLIVLYVGLDFRENQLFSEAERKRTLQYIDNSFDTNFGGKKLEGYFTQEKLDHGSESFWSRFKAELLDGGSFPGLAEAKLEISHHMAYYNAERRHSALGYLAPNHFETQFKTTSQFCPA